MHGPLNSPLRVTLVAILATPLVKTAGSAPLGSSLAIIQPQSLKINRLGGVGVVVGMFEELRQTGNGLSLSPSAKAHTSKLLSAILTLVSPKALCAVPATLPFMGIRCQPPPSHNGLKCNSQCAVDMRGKAISPCGACTNYECVPSTRYECCDDCTWIDTGCTGCEDFISCKTY
jgi:hypothetical protein